MKRDCKIPAQPYTARACIDVDINIFFNKQDRFNYSKQKCRYVYLSSMAKRSDSTRANILFVVMETTPSLMA